MSSKWNDSDHYLPSDSDDDDDDEDLEVLPPKAPSHGAASALSAAHCAPLAFATGRRWRGPRLSASGGDEADPIALLDDSDEENNDSLAERLGRKRSSQSNNKADVDKSQQEQYASMHKSLSAIVTKNPPTLAAYTDESDDKSCSSDDSVTKKLKAHRQARQAASSSLPYSAASTAAAALKHASSSDDDSSCSSDDSLAKRVKQLARARKPAAHKKPPFNPTRNKGRPAPASTTAMAPRGDDALNYSQSSSYSAEQYSKPKRQPAAEKQLEKEAERLRKQHEKEQAKALKEQAKLKKEQEKLAKKRARDAKLEAERTEKRRRQELKDDNKQKKGGFANQEIVVLMDPHLLRHPELTIADELQDAKYNVIEHASMLGCKTVQYIRKDLVRGSGGAEGAIAAMRAGDRQGFEHLPVVGVVFDDAMEFIHLLERDDNEDDDYPKLEEWLRSFQAGWRAAWKYESKQQPRLILYLYRATHVLEQLWIDHKRSKGSRSSAPPSEEELKDAFAWLLIQFQIECVECRENDHLSLELNRLTKKLSDQHYQKAYSDLDVSQKLAPLCGADASLYVQAKDCWLRQIQQIPRVSFNMARTLVQHYPTGYSLWKIYQDASMTDDEKRMLLTDCFGDNKSYHKLSEQVYQLLTRDDPNFLLV